MTFSARSVSFKTRQSLFLFSSLSLFSTMMDLKALTISTLFFLSSLAASANDWRSRSIYQVSSVLRLPFSYTHANVPSSSLTGLHKRMGRGQLVTLGTASIAEAATKASSTTWTTFRTWGSTPSGFPPSSRPSRGQVHTEKHTMGLSPYFCLGGTVQQLVGCS